MCIEGGEYITLKYNNNYYRVNEKLFRPVPAPKFEFGQIVRVRNSGEEAKIADIMWHFSNQEHYYFLFVRNKKRLGDILSQN